MNILALETSTNVCSVALFKNSKLTEIRETDEARIHSKKLPIFINEILQTTELSPNTLDGIAVSAGPGSYTGLRIGMSIAKGLAYSSDLPIIPINTLQSLDKQVAEKSEHWIAIYSHKNLVFAQKFCNQRNISEPNCIPFDELSNIPVFGYGISKYITLVNYTEILPSSRFIGEIAIENFTRLKEEDINSVRPFYLTEFNLTK